MMRWIRGTQTTFNAAREPIGKRHVDINLSAVQSISYDGGNDNTTLVLKGMQSITIDGNWMKHIPKFMASGASWTDGNIYEYNK